MADMQVRRILETCLYVNDLAAAEEFYSEVLGLTAFSRSQDRHVFFSCGNSVFLLFRPERTLQPDLGVPPHGAAGPGHVAFAVSENELGTWRRHLMQRGVRIETEIVWPGGGQSIYFRDPAGNSVELATPETWELDDG